MPIILKSIRNLTRAENNDLDIPTKFFNNDHKSSQICMKPLNKESMKSNIFLKIKVKLLINLLERKLIEFSLSLPNIFTKPNQIKNVVIRVIKTLIIEIYFLHQNTF